MPLPSDYRTKPFDFFLVAESGRYVGRAVYWKLYVIENSFRTLIHSILSVQLNPDWWDLVADAKLRTKVESIRKDYLAQPAIASPGRHEIYYVFLRDLNKILLTQVEQFRPFIWDIDDWIVELERIRLPRNLAGHMNWLDRAERDEINKAYYRTRSLVRNFHKSGHMVLIPK